MMMTLRRVPDPQKLPDFNPQATCSKCGGREITVRYRTDLDVWGKKVEWLCRQCERCHYLWDERVRLEVTDVDR